jgi:hypothetical protein
MQTHLVRGVCALGLLLALSSGAAQDSGNLLKSALKSQTPDAEVVRLDMDADSKPDIIERWWNGKRVRWLDENQDMQPGDTRGDQLGDVLQIDIGGDGQYDGLSDVNVKWADLDKDGIPDLQAWVTNPVKWDETMIPWPHGHWMIFQNFDKRGVLGWMDWEKFNFNCWGYTGQSDWLPNYHGNSVFLKIHAPVFSLNDPRLNWENPFAFYDFDNDGVTEMAMRWLDPPQSQPGKTTLTGRLNEAFVTFDLDNDSGKDNETDYDMTLRGAGGPGIDYGNMVIPLPGFRGDARFDACFQHNNWRHIEEVKYMPHHAGYDAFFSNRWEQVYLVFDEDDDDHRWERVEIYYPTAGASAKAGPIDIYSTGRWGKKDSLPGLAGHPQADTLGDRGEFDLDNSGKAELYVGIFDRKLHLAGAEWGAWIVDRKSDFHGGGGAPSPKPAATNVAELVKYTDTDTNGFFDTVEYDYDGDRQIDFKVCLLDYKVPGQAAPDTAQLLDARKLGWRGLHELFNRISEESWIEALQVYRAAWRRGLTTPELDKMAFASSKAQRHDHAYWIKEKVFRLVRQRLDEVRQEEPAKSASLARLEQDLTRFYYLGQFDRYTARLADVPAE